MSKLGRNKPCYCGSGKKYKKCCLAKDEEERRLEQKEEQYEKDVSLGRIDPSASDEEWEEDPSEDIVAQAETKKLRSCQTGTQCCILNDLERLG